MAADSMTTCRSWKLEPSFSWTKWTALLSRRVFIHPWAWTCEPVGLVRIARMVLSLVIMVGRTPWSAADAPSACRNGSTISQPGRESGCGHGVRPTDATIHLADL